MKALSRTILTATLCAGMFGNAAVAQLFQQSFSVAFPTVTNGIVADAAYVNASAPTNAQLTYLACPVSATMTGTGSALSIVTTSTSSRWVACRNVEFPEVPAAVKVTFDANITVGSSGTSGPKFVFYLGSGLSNSTTMDATTSIHSGFGIKYQSSGYYYMTTLGNTNNTTQMAESSNRTFMFVTNNSGAGVTYPAPDGTTESLANDTWDLWVGTVKMFNDQAATTGSQTLSSFKFGDIGGNYGRADIVMDNLSVETLGASFISTSASFLPPFGNAVVGSVTPALSYTVSGSKLTADVAVAAPAGFEISLDNTTFGPSLNLPQSDGSIVGQPVTIYARFAPTVGSGMTTGIISHTTTGGTIRGVEVNGNAVAAEPTTSSSITFDAITGYGVTVNTSGGNGDRRIIVARMGEPVSWTPSDAISPNGVNANFASANDQLAGNKIVYAGSGTSVTVTGLSVFTNYHFAVYEYNGTASNAENYRTLSPGTGQITTLKVPGLTVSPGTLGFGSIIKNTVSAEKTYVVSGAYLSGAPGSIAVTAPSGFEVSSASGTGFSSSLSIPFTDETLSATTVYVRFNPTAKADYAGTITNQGGGAPSAGVSVAGSGIDSSDINNQAIYVSPAGDDLTADGTISKPFYSLQKAVDLVKAGGTILMKGGVYQYSTRINIGKIGTAQAPIKLFAYPGERATLDFSSMADADANQGIRLTGSYWHFFGIDIKGAGDNGLLIERDKPAGGKYDSVKDSTHQGHDNVIEQCNFYENRDSGIQIKNMGAYNRIINCDSYYNKDSNDGDADGFSPKLTVGTGNYFYGCRAYQNSDDGWDMYLKASEDGFPQDMVTVIENCWCFMNGYYKNGGASGGNGNGFKLGGSGSKDQRHDVILRRCLSFENLQKGFDQNSNAGSMILINCTGFAHPYLNNSSHFSFRIDITTSPIASGKKFEHTNCVALWDGITDRKKSAWAPLEMIGGVQTTCNYQTSATDYISIDSTGCRGPRKADGSLPDLTFMHIKEGNTTMIDKGTIVEGIFYNGSAPDLGCFESSAPVGVGSQEPAIPQTPALAQNYPNPFNPSTNVSFQLSTAGYVSLRVFDVLGREVALLIRGEQPAGQHTATWNAAGFPSGVYYYVLETAANHFVGKMILSK